MERETFGKLSALGFITALILFITKKFFRDISLVFTIMNYGVYVFLGVGVLFLVILIWCLILDIFW